MSLIKLRDNCDNAFSRYIRLKYADDNGYVSCYTCGCVKEWKDMQCGHFVSRKHFCTRWDEENCRVQCVGCNIFAKGNMPVYAQKLLTEKGSKIIDELLEKSKGTCKFNRSDYEEMIEKFTKQTKYGT